jgi:hypothetical protein
MGASRPRCLDSDPSWEIGFRRRPVVASDARHDDDGDLSESSEASTGSRRRLGVAVTLVVLVVGAILVAAVRDEDQAGVGLGAQGDGSTSTTDPSAASTTTSVTAAASPSRERRASEYVGRQYEGHEVDRPAGTEVVGGTLLGSPHDQPLYSAQHLQDGTTHTIIFAKKVGEREARPIWTSVDAIELKLAHDEAIFVGQCYRGDKPTDFIVAIVDIKRGTDGKERTEESGPASPAREGWRLERGTERAVPVDVSGASCNTGFGE